jgi:hypothetical protein
MAASGGIFTRLHHQASAPQYCGWQWGLSTLAMNADGGMDTAAGSIGWMKDGSAGWEK